MRNLIKTALLATAGIALAGQVASAQGTWNQEDLILGVRVTGGTGAGTDYEVNLGNISTLTGSHTFSSSIASDLASLFGANWQTRADLSWSVATAATTTGQIDPRFTFYFSQPQGSTPSVFSAAGLGTPAGSIGSLVGTTAGGFRSTDFHVGAAGGVTAPGAGTVSSSLANSYTARVTQGSPTLNFNGPGPGEANGTTALDFYRFAANDTSHYLNGTFSFGAGGAFTFDAVAVPEPSTYGLLGGAGLLLVSLRRRLGRNQG